MKFDQLINGMGIPPEPANAYLNNSISPTTQTLTVAALAQ